MLVYQRVSLIFLSFLSLIHLRYTARFVFTNALSGANTSGTPLTCRGRLVAAADGGDPRAIHRPNNKPFEVEISLYWEIHLRNIFRDRIGYNMI
jgi:hypothetical protein